MVIVVVMVTSIQSVWKNLNQDNYHSSKNEKNERRPTFKKKTKITNSKKMDENLKNKNRRRPPNK
jgi:choline-glycine betaine transporter